MERPRPISKKVESSACGRASQWLIPLMTPSMALAGATWAGSSTASFTTKSECDVDSPKVSALQGSEECLERAGGAEYLVERGEKAYRVGQAWAQVFRQILLGGCLREGDERPRPRFFRPSSYKRDRQPRAASLVPFDSWFGPLKAEFVEKGRIPRVRRRVSWTNARCLLC